MGLVIGPLRRVIRIVVPAQLKRRDLELSELASAIAEQSPIRYQASRNSPGLLEQIDQAGKTVVGQFLEGEFVPADAN